MNPIELVSAAPWSRVVFTTYSLSLSFIEAVILDALLRGKGRDALILADPDGVRSALSEEGARRVGRDYEVVPVMAQAGGLFHPKIGVFIANDDVHVSVGSGNLTFSGWGGNVEYIEHLHPSFAADAIQDTAEFFEALASGQRVITLAGDDCAAIAATLRRSAQGQRRNASLRLLHNMNDTILDQLDAYAFELGGATRITSISPFYDLGGLGLSRLQEQLRCDEVHLHHHPYEPVWGRPSNFWPHNAGRDWSAVQVQGGVVDGTRNLHGKSIEILCRRGRLLLTGSANSTNAALLGKNVEASVLRVERDRDRAWALASVPHPGKPSLAPPIEERGKAALGILSAKLEGENIKGRVLTGVAGGPAQAVARSVGGTRDLGPVEIGEGGHFVISLKGQETLDLLAGRLVLCLDQMGRVSEGFVSLDALLSLPRRVGSVAVHIIAIITGTAVPADVVAILGWASENPNRLSTPSGSKAAIGAEAKDDQGSRMVNKYEPRWSSSQDSVLPDHEDPGDGEPTSFGWQQVIRALRQAFTPNTGPASSVGVETLDEEDQEDDERRKRQKLSQKDNVRLFETYESFLVAMTDPSWAGRHAGTSLAVGHYVVHMLRAQMHLVEPARVLGWLRQILPQVVSLDGPDGGMITAAALLSFAASPDPQRAMGARRFFVRRGVDPSTIEVDPESIPAFLELMEPPIGLERFLQEVVAARTRGEQVRSFLAACQSTGARDGYDDLTSYPHWERLRKALTSTEAFSKIYVAHRPELACPRHHRTLPRAEKDSLRLLGVAQTACCGRFMLNTDC